MKTNLISTKPAISQAAYEQLKLILKTTSESPSTDLGELHWNACKRHVLDCIVFQLEVQG